MLPVSKYMMRALLLFVCTAPLSLNVVAQDSATAAILTPPSGPGPKINGPRIFGVRPGHPILFTIPATGNRPMTFSAQHLPPGVKLDKNSGRLSGTVAKPGEYTITLNARNKQGNTSRDLKLVAGEKIGLTPPMGWNSWNVYGTKVTQQKVLDNARAMVSTGLINHGWSYMNIDDAWQGARGGKDNAIQPDTAVFPDLQQLANEVHGLGLKIGIYSTPWVESYGHHVGGSANNPEGAFERTKENIRRNQKLFPYAIGKYSFVKSDVKQWAEWGIDYLKYDWNPNELPETKEMYDALRNSGRDIFFSLSNSTPFNSIAELSTVSNSWRTGGDIRDSWKSLKSRLFSQDKWAPFAGQGHWNDPDMMIVGYLGWGKDLHPTLLTPDEQYTHMSAWCLLSVPLLLGCDITKMDAFTLSLLSNDEVIAVNQDPLGKQATVITQDEDTGIMAKELADGSIAAGLFNIGDNGKKELTLKWEDLHLSGSYIVRDLWRQKDIGTFDGSFKTDVAQHGVVMIGLRKKQ